VKMRVLETFYYLPEWFEKRRMKPPTAELWDIIMSQVTEVALTIDYPNRSRDAGYYN